MHFVLALLLLATPAAAVTTYTAGTIACAVFTKAEAKQRFGRRGQAGFACTNLITGEVLGTVTKARTGAAICPVQGQAFVDRCSVVSICGEAPQTVCVP